MRLFNRRKEMEFDDPRLVGMAPLKATEENFGQNHHHQSQHQHQQNLIQQQQQQLQQMQQNLTALKEDLCATNGVLTVKKFSNDLHQNQLQQQYQDKCRVSNSNGGVLTWKRVARPWDSLRRSESSEHLSRSVMSSTINRRKTLHFYPESEDKFSDKSLPRLPSSERSRSCSSDQNDGNVVTPKRKIGRVESLRLLLSKSNRIYRGKSSNKLDKGTDTQDLENDLENSLLNYNMENDEVFQSKYSSFLSLKSGTCNFPMSSSEKNALRRLQITKATSCENLSLKNSGNQGITLPGHRDMSTSTSPLASLSHGTSVTTAAKRCSFPYAYIRSRLTSLQEEPKNSPAASNPTTSSTKAPGSSGSTTNTTTSITSTATTTNSDDSSQDQRQKCSLASKFIHKGFYHSMGNLLSESKDSESNRSPDEVDAGIVDDEDVVIRAGGVNTRIFDPLKQIRIDLLHRNPSEFDEQSPSPTFWGRRSYSIGDILEKQKGGKGSSTSGGGDSSNGVEESGYDSDSTRNGNEDSPRNSTKSPSSEAENELNEPEPSSINSNTTTKDSTVNEKATAVEVFDTQSQSNSESSTTSMYSFPASGCLITINRSPGEKTDNNFVRKVGHGSMIEISSEMDQLEDVDDFYSSSTDTALENASSSSTSTNGTGYGVRPVIINYSRTTSNTTSTPGINKDRFPNREKSEKELPEASSTLSIRKEITSDAQKQISAPSLRLRNRVRDRDREWNSIRPSRSKSLCLSIFTVTFHKGPGKKSLGFSVIGGKDSPVPGIFVKRIFPYGQASEEGGLTEGDEILSVNGQPLANSTHAEALNVFKSIKTGDVALEVARREFLPTNSQNLKRQYSQLNSKSCEQLHKAY